MAKINAQSMLQDLLEAKENFKSAMAVLEDNLIDEATIKKATEIIQDAQINSEIALEHIQG